MADDTPVRTDLCETYKQGLENRLGSIEKEHGRALKERKDIVKTQTEMSTLSTNRLDEINKSVEDKTEKAIKEINSKTKRMSLGVSMKLFLWVSSGLFGVLCLSIGYLYAMNGDMGEYKNGINTTVSSLSTDTKLIQQEIRHTKEILRRVEKSINGGR